jgi:hypothetical protein
LVVANALSRNHDTDKAAKDIADHTIGSLFLGTPFEGSNTARYGSIAVDLLKYFTSTQPENITDLKERSVKLAAINDLFAKFLIARNRNKKLPYLELACFFEAQPLYKGTLRIGFIVEKASATWPGIDAQSIPADHIDMCKFGDQAGSDYRSVADQLIQWIKSIDKPRDPTEGGVPGLIAEVRYPNTLGVLTAVT